MDQVTQARLEATPLTQPGKSRGIFDALKYRFLLSLLVKKEMRARYRGSILGMFWTYLKPGVQFFIYYFFFGVVFGSARSGEVGGNFAIYMFAGLSVINLFIEILRNCTLSIRQNGELVQKIYLPRELFPLSAYRVALNHFFPQVLILLVVCVITGWRPTPLNLLAILFGLVIISLFAIGCGLIFATINVFFQDAENFVEMLGMICTWAAPVLYHYSMIVKFFKGNQILESLYYSCPLINAPELFHYGFVSYNSADTAGVHIPNIWMYGGIGLLISLAFCVIGQAVFHHFEGKFAQNL